MSEEMSRGVGFWRRLRDEKIQRYNRTLETLGFHAESLNDLHSAHPSFRLPCGHLLHTAQLFAHHAAAFHLTVRAGGA